METLLSSVRRFSKRGAFEKFIKFCFFVIPSSKCCDFVENFRPSIVNGLFYFDVHMSTAIIFHFGYLVGNNFARKVLNLNNGTR